jgi:hypothetical protein
MRPSGAESARDGRRSVSSTPPLAPQHRSVAGSTVEKPHDFRSYPGAACRQVPRRPQAAHQLRKSIILVAQHPCGSQTAYCLASLPPLLCGISRGVFTSVLEVMRHESRRCWPTLEEHWHNRRRDLNSALPSGVSRRMPAQKLSGSSRNSPPCSCLPPQREVEPSILAYQHDEK